MPTTGSAKFPYPNTSATPDVPGDILTLGQRLSKMSGAGVAFVANAAERTALVTNGDAFDGLVVVQADTRELTQYDGASFLPLGNNKYIISRAATQSIANGTNVVIDFDTVVLNSFVSAFAEAAGTITCSIAGTYKIEWRLQFTANATGIRGYRLRKNGSSIQESTMNSAAGTIATAVNDFGVITLGVGDTLNLDAYQSSGGALNLTSAVFFATKLL